jgi:phenylacetate-CoA ligase
MPYHLPEEESLDRSALERLQREKLAKLFEVILRSNPFYRRKLASLRFDPLGDPLARLPFTTRAEIEQDQIDHPSFGSNLTFDPHQYCRYHQTSGSTGRPVRWLDTAESWAWMKRCWSIVYRGAGVVPEDRIAFLFSFGPFIGFWLAFEAAADLGNLCFPGGGMTTAARLRLIRDNDVTVVCCTPTYALRMAETAASEGMDLSASSVRLLIVAGEPGGNISAARSRIEQAWGARVIDHCGMTEIGPSGFECVEAPGGLHVIESEFIAEAVDPAGDRPVPDGELGELVLTNLGRTASPLIRYRTGDLVRITRARCACGRSFARLKGGILGRKDDMMIIRGNNVFPSAIEAILREFDEIAEYRLSVVDRKGMNELRIEIEIEPRAMPESTEPARQPESTSVTERMGAAELPQPVAKPAPTPKSVLLGDRVAAAIHDRLFFRPEVLLVPPGSLPRFEMKARRFAR